MDFEVLLQKARELGLGGHEGFFREHWRPAIDLVRSESTTKLGGSRIGGPACLPPSFAWPHHSHGPYQFLAQINFADVPEEGTPLPAKGLLSLFHAHDPEELIFFTEPEFLHAEWFPDETDLVTTDSPHADDDNGFPVSFRPTLDLPLGRYQVGSWPFSAEESDLYMSLWESLHTTTDHLLGHPVAGSLGYNPSPGPDWDLLLNLYSHEDMYWSWCDGGHLMLFIERHRLAVNDFSKIRCETG